MTRWLAAASAMLLALPGASANGRNHKGSPKATKKSIAVVSILVRGTAEPALRTQLQRSIKAGLSQAELKMVSNDEVIESVGSRTELINCTTAACLQTIGQLTKAQRFIGITIEAEGAAYKVSLELFDREGKVRHHVKHECAVCTLSDINEIVRKASYELVTTLPAKPVSVVIVTRPEGGKLHIDGAEVGSAPFQGKLIPGRHRLKVLLPGHAEIDKMIEVRGTAEGPERFEIILTPVAVDEGTRPAPRYRVWKWAAAVGSAALLTTGIVLVAKHNDPTCTLMGDQQACPRLYNTMPGGLLSIAGAVGLAATSAWMFKRDRRQAAERRSAAIVPTRGGAAASLLLRF